MCYTTVVADFVSTLVANITAAIDTSHTGTIPNCSEPSYMTADMITRGPHA